MRKYFDEFLQIMRQTKQQSHVFFREGPLHFSSHRSLLRKFMQYIQRIQFTSTCGSQGFRRSSTAHESPGPALTGLKEFKPVPAAIHE
jgi:hypothetical protein